MTLDEQLKFCRICQKRKLNPAIGIVCSLTEEKPAFEESCENFAIDEAAAKTLLSMEKEAAAEESGGFFAAEKKGMQKGALGGILMIAIALIWFFGGLAAGYIFYYPPVLLIIGIVSLVKGLATGNLSGEKSS